MVKEQIREKIENAQSVVILSHINQDTDALGSSFAMCDVLRSMGKKAVCCIEEKPEKKLEFFGDNHYILETQAEKEYDLAIVLDCGSIDRLGTRINIYNACKDRISIDHHGTNTGFAEYNYVEPDASATGEILFYLFREWGFQITDLAAMYLYSAIVADCGCFKYSCVSKKTMIAGAELIEYDFDHADVCLKLFDTIDEKVMRLHGRISENIHSYDDGKIRVVSTDDELLKEFGIEEKETGNIVNIPRSVAGTLIGVELKKRKDEIRVSLRSNFACDVSVVAKELGGGGHERAAGAKVDVKSLDEAEALVVKMIREKCF